MTDKKETPNWNPPKPPWNPEPEPLSLLTSPVQENDDPDPDPEEEPEPVNMGLEDKVEEMMESGELKLEAVSNPEDIDPPGLEEYTVMCPTGITVNGKVFAAGPHLVDEGIYETLSNLDAPYQ